MARANDHLADLNERPRTVEIISYADAWTTAIDVVLSDAPIMVSSVAYDISTITGAWVLIFVDSTAVPTNIRVLVQFSHDGGVTWWDYEEGLWASLFWEDTDTASGIYKTYLLPCGGHNTMRFRAIGTGTSAANRFDVRVLFRPFRGAYGVAHA